MKTEKQNKNKRTKEREMTKTNIVQHMHPNGPNPNTAESMVKRRAPYRLAQMMFSLSLQKCELPFRLGFRFGDAL
jgi:hypothetical protein